MELWARVTVDTFAFCCRSTRKQFFEVDRALLAVAQMVAELHERVVCDSLVLGLHLRVVAKHIDGAWSDRERITWGATVGMAQFSMRCEVKERTHLWS